MTNTSNILVAVNAKGWSWGATSAEMFKLLSGYIIVKVLKYGTVPIQMMEAGVVVTVKLPPIPIDKGLTDFFDLTLLQNVEAIGLVQSNHKKIVVRSGGMVINNKASGTRYNDELAKVGAVIATNQQLFDIAKEANENTVLIPNGVDLELFKPRIKEVDDKERKFTAGFAGNIWGPGLSYKGYDLFVQGTIGLEIETITMLHNHNQVPHEEMTEKFYHKIDCLVLPSAGEGCSNVTMEALACGVPVIITKVGYHGEKLTDRFNCLFVKREIKDIIEKIQMLMEFPRMAEKLSKNGRDFAEAHHDIKKIAQEYDKVFKMVLRS